MSRNKVVAPLLCEESYPYRNQWLAKVEEEMGACVVWLQFGKEDSGYLAGLGRHCGGWTANEEFPVDFFGNALFVLSKGAYVLFRTSEGHKILWFDGGSLNIISKKDWDKMKKTKELQVDELGNVSRADKK